VGRIYSWTGQRRLNSEHDEKMDRRIHCWDVQRCSPITRAQCPAYAIRRSCWDLWRGRSISGCEKRCCLKYDDCRECPLAPARIADIHPLNLNVQTCGQASVATPRVSTCPNLLPKGMPGGIAPSGLSACAHEPPHEDRSIVTCRVRRGVVLLPGYVRDICRSRRYNQCLFYLEP
jgi:hypothetical protein